MFVLVDTIWSPCFLASFFLSVEELWTFSEEKVAALRTSGDPRKMMETIENEVATIHARLQEQLTQLFSEWRDDFLSSNSLRLIGGNSTDVDLLRRFLELNVVPWFEARLDARLAVRPGVPYEIIQAEQEILYPDTTRELRSALSDETPDEALSDQIHPEVRALVEDSLSAFVECLLDEELGSPKFPSVATKLVRFGQNLRAGDANGFMGRIRLDADERGLLRSVVEALARFHEVDSVHRTCFMGSGHVISTPVHEKGHLSLRDACKPWGHPRQIPPGGTEPVDFDEWAWAWFLESVRLGALENLENRLRALISDSGLGPRLSELSDLYRQASGANQMGLVHEAMGIPEVTV